MALGRAVAGSVSRQVGAGGVGHAAQLAGHARGQLDLAASEGGVGASTVPGAGGQMSRRMIIFEAGKLLVSTSSAELVTWTM